MTGLSKSRLGRTHQVLSGHIERQEMPGLVALVSRHDDVHVETLGTMSVGHPVPMKRDTIFRIASLTKPITAVAAMILVEECKLRLDESIEPWLPEFANRRVLKSMSSKLNDTVAALRAITVRDLLTFRMGFGSVMAMPDTYPIQKLIREYRIGGDGPPLPAQAPGTEEWLQKLGSLPWMAQPGERWMYQVSADVLGVLIARVSGQSLGTFMRQRIFEPLGMRDTAFHVSSEKIERLPACYFFNRQTKTLELYDDAANSAWRPEPPFESGGGGLVATIDDYFAFSRMILNEGRHGREQVLSRVTVALMTSDQLTPEQRTGAEIFFGGYRSWGFGVAVDIQRNEIFRTPGRFGWDGGLGISAYTDPAEAMIGILFTQRMMDSPEPPKVSPTSGHWRMQLWPRRQATAARRAAAGAMPQGRGRLRLRWQRQSRPNTLINDGEHLPLTGIPVAMTPLAVLIVAPMSERSASPPSAPFFCSAPRRDDSSGR